MAALAQLVPQRILVPAMVWRRSRRARWPVHLAELVAVLAVLAVILRPGVEVSLGVPVPAGVTRQADGTVANAYGLEVVNRSSSPQSVTLRVDGITGASLAIDGAATAKVLLAPGEAREIGVSVSVPTFVLDPRAPHAIPVRFYLVGADGKASVRSAVFQR